MSKSVYLSGPMAGQDNLNEAAFRAVEEYLLRQPGTDVYEVVVPHDLPAWQHKGECPDTYRSTDGSHTSSCFLRVDLMEMLRCDEVWMLPGWENSVGARLEMQVAAACGIPLKFAQHELVRWWQEVQPIVNEAYESLKRAGMLEWLRGMTQEPAAKPQMPHGMCGHSTNLNGHCYESVCPNYQGRFGFAR